MDRKIPRDDSTGMKLATFVGMFIATLIGAAFFTAIPAGLFGIYHESMSVFYGYWALLTVPIALLFSVIAVSGRFKKIELIGDALDRTVSHVDYFTFENHQHAWALDAVNNHFVYARARGLSKDPAVVVMPAEKILGVYAHDASVGKFITTGSAVSAKLINNELEREAKKVTGLYIFNDDLENNKVFVPMHHRLAERWELAIEKMRAGTLEPTQAPKDMATIGM